MKAWVVAALCVALLFMAAHACGAYGWNRRTQALLVRLNRARMPAPPGCVDFSELASLPAPVQRYLRTVLVDGQPLVDVARLEHDGSFDTSETRAQWRAFRSQQWISTARPGFVWDGRIALAPGLPVRVHDAYVAGEGILHASLLGLASLADLRGTPDVARGELMRYLAEAPLVPTALLPSQGVRWTPVDETTADATLADGATSVTLRFQFDERDLVDTVSARGRARTVGGAVVETPWKGRWWGYERHDGMLVPEQGEVAWLLPGGWKSYWR